MTGLLPDLPSSGQAPAFEWDPRALAGMGAYRDSAGRMVTWSTVRDELDRVLDGISAEARALSQQLIDGGLDVAGWHAGMADLVKSAHLSASAAATGGWEQMTPAAYGRAGGRIGQEYKYLDGFAGELGAGTYPPASAPARAAMYGQAGRTTYYKAAADAAEQAGADEEKSVIRPGENCDGCLDQADRGWVPLRTLIPIGRRDCLSNCRCHMRYRQRPGGQSQGTSLMETAISRGGITYQPLDGTSPTSGFAVSPYLEREAKIRLAEAQGEKGAQLVADYIQANLDLLADPATRAYLGMWVDDLNLYLDVSVVVESQAEAMALAEAAEQLAIYDIGRGEVIDLGTIR